MTRAQKITPTWTFEAPKPLPDTRIPCLTKAQYAARRGIVAAPDRDQLRAEGVTVPRHTGAWQVPIPKAVVKRPHRKDHIMGAWPSEPAELCVLRDMVIAELRIDVELIRAFSLRSDLRKPIHDERMRLFTALSAKGLTLRQIGHVVDLNPSTIGKMFKAHGILAARPNRQVTPRVAELIAELGGTIEEFSRPLIGRKDYHERALADRVLRATVFRRLHWQGLSCLRIADECGMGANATTVRLMMKWLAKHEQAQEHVEVAA